MSCDIIPQLKSQIIAVCFSAFVTGTYAGDEKKAHADAVDNTFFVVFKRDRTRVGAMSIGRRLHGAKIQRRHKIFDIESVSVKVKGADTLEKLRRNPGVDYVEPVLPVFAFCSPMYPHMDSPTSPIYPPDPTANKGNCVKQLGAPWNLDRIDQRNGTDGIYHYDEQNGGSQSYVYVLDTKLAVTHPEFESRAVHGKTICGSCRRKKLNPHGTHVAAVIGGKTYGVAKKVNIVGVQILNNDGTGTTDDSIEALEWVLRDCKRRARIGRCIVNLSIGTETPSRYFNSVVDRLVSRNIPVVAAAGNGNKDACGASPASALGAITVGSVDRRDRRSRFSNFGDCVNTFAPGEGIVSAFAPKASGRMSGTSQAAPHVTGLLALYLTALTMSTPSDTTPGDCNTLRSFIKENSVVDIVKDAKGGKNRVLYIKKYCNLNTDISKSSCQPSNRSLDLATCYFTTIIFNSVVVLSIFIRL